MKAGKLISTSLGAPFNTSSDRDPFTGCYNKAKMVCTAQLCNGDFRFILSNSDVSVDLC